MPVLDVSCPACSAKLKAPDTMIGKKAKCKKCGNSFRIPGGPENDVSALRSAGAPRPAIPDDDVTEVMMAEAVDDVTMALPADVPAPVPAAKKDVGALPSADAFDFSKSAKPAAPAPAPPKPAPPPPQAKPTIPAPPAAPAAKAATPPAPPKAAPAPPAAPIPAPPQAKSGPVPPPAARPAAPPPAPPKPAAIELPPEEPAAPAPAADDPFAFGDSPASDEKRKSKKRRDEEEEDEPKAKKKRKDEDEEEPTSKKKRKRDEEDEDEEPKAKKKQEDDEDEDEPKSKKAGSGDDEPYNPFANYDPGDGAAEPPPENPWAEPKKKKKKKRDEDEEDDKDAKGKKKKRRDDDEEDDEAEKPRYVRPAEKGSGTMKSLVLTGLAGVVALGLAVAAVVVFVKHKREAEQARLEKERLEKEKLEKKEEPPPAPPENPPPGPGPNPGPGPGPKPKDKDPDPKPKDKNPDPKPKEKDPDPVPGLTRPAVGVPKLRTFTVGTLAADAKPADKVRKRVILETPVGTVKRVFPPSDVMSGDTAVLFQLNPGVGGVGEKLALDFYGPADNLVAGDRIEYAGDGLANPIADFTVVNKKAYFLAATGGKLHVWAVSDRQKLADGISPYAEKPEHAKSGVAAAFFSPDPNLVVLVSTAGAVLLYDIKANKPVKDFIPPNGATGRVALGQSIAKAEGGASVGIAVAGVLYQVKADPALTVLRQYDLGGDVNRSLALSISGTPGRFIYVFEANGPGGKPDKVVLGLPLGAEVKPIMYSFPTATAGEPKGALWAGDEFGGVATDRGVVWFSDHEGKFEPMLMTQPPAPPGQYFGDEKYFWYAIPHPNPKEDKKAVLAAITMPFDSFENYVKFFKSSKPLVVARIDANNLSK